MARFIDAMVETSLCMMYYLSRLCIMELTFI